MGTTDWGATDGARVAAETVLPHGEPLSEHGARHPGVRLLVGGHRGGRVHAAPPGQPAPRLLGRCEPLSVWEVVLDPNELPSTAARARRHRVRPKSRQWGVA